MIRNTATENKIVIIASLFISFACHGTSKIIVTSAPKSGTNLVIQCIHAITGLQVKSVKKKWLQLSTKDRETEFLMSHALCTPENIDFIERNNFKGIFIIRDPRDQCISMVHYAKSKDKVGNWPTLARMEFNSALTSWIKDTSLLYSTKDRKACDKTILSLKGIDDFYRRYLPWMNHPLIYTTTFEKLVGPNGGGSKEDQIQEIMNIAQHIDHPISKPRAEQIAQEIFGQAGTFRSGQIGEHKDVFTQEHKDLFKKEAGQLLIDLGYEKGLTW